MAQFFQNTGLGLIRCGTAAIFTFALGTGTGSTQAAVEVGGIIASDTTWTSADTIIVTDSVTVLSSAHLTIEAGSVILCAPRQGIFVQGGLTAIGDRNHRILLTGVADTAGGSLAAGFWYGLNLQSSAAAVVRCCDIRFASNGVSVRAASAEFLGCIVEDFLSRGFNLDGATSVPLETITLDRCIVRQRNPEQFGLGTAVYVTGSAWLTVDHCRLSNCQYGIDIYSSGLYPPRFDVTRCDIDEIAWNGIYVHGGG